MSEHPFGGLCTCPHASDHSLPHEPGCAGYRPESPAPKKKRPHYLPSHAEVKLRIACRMLDQWLPEDCYGVFLVGSALQRPDFRDVDVRAVMKDEAFAATFPSIDPERPHLNGMWNLVCFTVSEWLSSTSGLPVDFQIQQATRANAKFTGERNCLSGSYPFYPGGG